jgi:Lrp/AsnC family transcriptional regulator, leucine-responsive regulatory protein
VPLDERDRAILRILLRDPRTSVADIARDVGAQRDTILYRIERFEKLGLVQKYHTIVEPSALGLSVFMLLLISLSPAHEVKRDEFIEKLAAMPCVTHIARLIGPYDYFVQVAATDMSTFDAELSKIKTLVPGAVQTITTSAILDGIKTDDFSALV